MRSLHFVIIVCAACSPADESSEDTGPNLYGDEEPGIQQEDTGDLTFVDTAEEPAPDPFSIFVMVNCGGSLTGVPHLGESTRTTRFDITRITLRIECASCAAPVEEHVGLLEDDWEGVTASWWLTQGDVYTPDVATTAFCWGDSTHPNIHVITAELDDGSTACAIMGTNSEAENERFDCAFVGETDYSAR